jgi:hypothetical protein
MINPICFSDLEFSLHENVNTLLLSIDKDAQEILKKHNAFIAGGSLTISILIPTSERSLYEHKSKLYFDDIDVYFRNKEDLDNCLKELKNVFKFRETKTQYAINIPSHCVSSHPVQLIHYPELLGTPYNVIKQFDFTINQVAYDLQSDELFFTGDFFTDLIKKELKINSNLLSPLSTLIRVEKYKNKGFVWTTEQQLKLALLLSKLEFENMAEALREVRKSIYSHGISNEEILKYKNIDYSPDKLVKILDTICHNNTQFTSSYTLLSSKSSTPISISIPIGVSSGIGTTISTSTSAVSCESETDSSLPF